jgi:hypothetical protein
MEQEPTSLEQVLDRIGNAESDESRVSLGAILREIEHRSFGSLLLVAGLITLVPITGESALMGVFVLLIAVQMLFHHRHFWLPRRLLVLSIKQDKLCKALNRLKPAARYADRLLRPRLTPLVRGAGAYLIAVTCAAIALIMPLMELVPFSAYSASLVLSLFGLALIGRDGLLALIALCVAVVIVGVAVYSFF